MPKRVAGQGVTIMGSGQSRPMDQRPKPKVTGRDKAILELKVQRDRLKHYQVKIQVVLDREHELAKEQLRLGNKDRALLALKKKRYQEQLLEKSNAQLFNLEHMCSSIEFAQVELQVLDGLKAGNKVLTELQDEMKMEDVERLMEETAEAIEYQNEISAMLSQKLGDADELAAEEELEAILAEQAAEKLEGLPEVPKTKLVEPEPEPEKVEVKTEEEELEELEAVPA